MEAYNTNYIQHEESGYRNILDSALDSVFVIHGDSYVYVNKQGASLLGYDAPKELIGKSMFEHTHVDDQELVRERAIARQRGENVSSRYEITLIKKNGEEFPAEVHVSYLEYEGKPCSLSYVRSITERKRHEDRLHVLHLFTAQMASSNNLDEVETITYEALTQVLGLNRGSLGLVKDDVLTHLYRWHMNIKHPYTMPLDGPGITIRAVNTGKTQLVHDVIEDPDYVMGGEKELATRSELAVPIMNRDRVIGVINLENKEPNAFSVNEVKIVEILAVHIGTAIERMENSRELARIRLARDRELFESFKWFSSMIQHDLRGPLSTINNSVYLIEKNPRSLEKPIRLIKTSLDVLGSILEDWSQKIYSHSIHRKKTNINNLIQNAVESIIIPENISIRREISIRKLYNIDDHAILRVLNNLIKNAVEAMPDGGELSINAGILDEHLVLSVTDEGPGIEDEILHNIFSPFHTSKEHGTGLGLAYCKQAVEAHGGQITFKSEPGKGATFTVRIPLQ